MECISLYYSQEICILLAASNIHLETCEEVIGILKLKSGALKLSQSGPPALAKALGCVCVALVKLLSNQNVSQGPAALTSWGVC